MASSKYLFASSRRRPGPVTWRTDSLRAAAKLSDQGRSKTLVTCRSEMSLVLTEELVFTTMISSTMLWTESRQFAIVAVSCLTIMVKEVGIGMADASVGALIIYP